MFAVRFASFALVLPFVFCLCFVYVCLCPGLVYKQGSWKAPFVAHQAACQQEVITFVASQAAHMKWPRARGTSQQVRLARRNIVAIRFCIFGSLVVFSSVCLCLFLYVGNQNLPNTKRGVLGSPWGALGVPPNKKQVSTCRCNSPWEWMCLLFVSCVVAS